MYEVTVNGTIIGKNMSEYDAITLAERYMEEHRGEELKMDIRRQEDSEC